MEKLPVIAVVGATASGKSALAVHIARCFNGEIISADSMQIYRGMNIATAKPTAEEMGGIPHHLIDFLPVTEKYSVAMFTRQAKEILSDIQERNKVPVVCGGTGLYIDSLLGNMAYEEQEDNTEIRCLLENRVLNEGIDSVFDELKSIDPEYASQLHRNNKGRIIRALEMYILTGEKPGVLRARAVNTESVFKPTYLSIEYSDRELLYSRIDRRVDIMMSNGLEAEAREYYSLDAKSTASQAIGYKELSGYFNGEITKEEAIDNLKRATRRYAKRQLTWFRRNPDIHRIFADLLPEGVSVEDAADDILLREGFMKV